MTGQILVRNGETITLQIRTVAENEISTQQPMDVRQEVKGVVHFEGGGQSGVWFPGGYRLGDYPGDEVEEVMVKESWHSSVGEGVYQQTTTHKIMKEG